MVSKADAAKFKRANDELADRIARDLRRTWSALGATTPEGKRDALLDVVPGLVSTYGDAAAAMAVEYFEHTTGMRGEIHAGSSLEAVQGSVRGVAGGLWEGKDAETLSLVVGAATRHALQAGRSSIYESAMSTPGVGYARQPEAGACNWCLLLSSRGAVYTRETVTKVSEARQHRATGGKKGRSPGSDFHDFCNCQPVAVRFGDTLPYDAKGLYDDRYMPARQADPESLISRADFASDAAYQKRVREISGMTDSAISARMRIMFGGS